MNRAVSLMTEDGKSVDYIYTYQDNFYGADGKLGNRIIIRDEEGDTYKLNPRNYRGALTKGYLDESSVCLGAEYFTAVSHDSHDWSDILELTRGSYYYYSNGEADLKEFGVLYGVAGDYFVYVKEDESRSYKKKGYTYYSLAGNVKVQTISHILETKPVNEYVFRSRHCTKLCHALSGTRYRFKFKDFYYDIASRNNKFNGYTLEKFLKVAEQYRNLELKSGMNWDNEKLHLVSEDGLELCLVNSQDMKYSMKFSDMGNASGTNFVKFNGILYYNNNIYFDRNSINYDRYIDMFRIFSAVKNNVDVVVDQKTGAYRVVIFKLNCRYYSEHYLLLQVNGKLVNVISIPRVEKNTFNGEKLQVYEHRGTRVFYINPVAIAFDNTGINIAKIVKDAMGGIVVDKTSNRLMALHSPRGGRHPKNEFLQ